MKTKKFAMLDFLTILPFAKVVILFPFIAIFVGVVTKDIYNIIIAIISSALVISIYPFTISESFDLDIMYSTVPGSRRQIVNGRYVYYIVYYWASAIFSVIVGWIVSLITGYEYSILEGALTTIQLFAFVSLITGIYYCILFKFGYLKYKLISIIPIILMFLGGPVIINKFKDGITDLSDISPILIAIISLGLGSLVLYISSIISQKIYASKDF